MLTMPDGTSVIAMEVVYNGDPAQGEKELAALRAIGKPMDDTVKVQDYMVMQTQEDATVAHGIRSYAKNGMVKEVTPELLDALVEGFPHDPRYAFFTHTAGGAVAQGRRTRYRVPASQCRNDAGVLRRLDGPGTRRIVDGRSACVGQWLHAVHPAATTTTSTWTKANKRAITGLPTAACSRSRASMTATTCSA